MLKKVVMINGKLEIAATLNMDKTPRIASRGWTTMIKKQKDKTPM